MKKLPNWLRWLILIPGTLIGFVIIDLVVGIVNSGTGLDSDLIKYTVRSLGDGAIIVILASYIAPSAKLTVAYVGAAIVILVGLAMMGINSVYHMPWVMMLSTTFFMIVGAILGVVYVSESERKSTSR